jgi:hypothetical protein
MARQAGAVPFIGTIGEISFYYDKIHGYLARRKGGPSKRQIKTKRSMEVVRNNNSEFGRASSYSVLLRSAFHMLLLHCKEYTMSRRLQSLLLSVIHMDQSRPRGQRDVLQEELIILQGFDLNMHLSYSKFFKEDVDVEILKDTVVAKGRCTIPTDIARRADYYKVVSVAAAADFKKKNYLNDVKESKLLPCKESKRFVFEHGLTRQGYLFYGLAICFYKKNAKKVEMINEGGMKAGFVSFIGR